MADQRIDAVGADADIQHAHGRATGNVALVAFGQQVGEKVHVVGSPRHWRTEEVGRNVPVLDTVEGLEQRPVEHAHRSRVGEVDAFLAIGVEDHELAQFGAALDQLREVIAALVTVAWVQAGFLARLDALGRGGGLGLLARGFGFARGVHGGIDSGRAWNDGHCPIFPGAGAQGIVADTLQCRSSALSAT